MIRVSAGLRFALLLLFALLAGGCSNLRGVRLLAPEWSGLEPLAPGIYVEPGMPNAQEEKLMTAKAWAEEAVRRAYGEVTSAPVINACWTEACYEGFGGMGSKAKVYGERILLSPRGLDRHFLAHEWSHAELHKRLTFSAYLRVPAWFDEGVAVAVSEEPNHSEAHWRYLVEHDIPRPDRGELMKLESLRQWINAVHRYGSPQNKERIARGEPPIAPLYTAAGHELRPWLKTAGSAGLLALIERVNAGEAFTRVYREIGESRKLGQ